MDNVKAKKENNLVEVFNEDITKRIAKIIKTNFNNGNAFPNSSLQYCTNSADLLSIVNDAITYLYILNEYNILSKEQLEDLINVDIDEFANMVDKYGSQVVSMCILILSLTRNQKESKMKNLSY